MFAWDQLIRTTSNRTLYVLGAGASDPEIKFGDKLSTAVRTYFWDNGIFPTYIQPSSPLKSAILKPIRTLEKSDRIITQRELDDLTPPEFVEVIVAQLLTKIDGIFPIQYRIFDLFYPSVIFNFNVDNLADQIHWKHEVLYPHMKIDPKVAHSTIMQRALDWMILQKHVGQLFPYWRPVPESQSITSAEPYHRLKDVFSSMRYVCFIGYSFGAWSGGIDDAESFEMITDLMRWKPKTVVVVNPHPNNLAALIESSIKQKVFCLSCKWNILAKFIVTGFFRKAFLESGGSIRGITDCFFRFEELLHNIDEKKANCYQEQFSIKHQSLRRKRRKRT